MNGKGSDIMFNVENQIIYAHKEILIRKSTYFDNLFNSGMTESRQLIIEFRDCEYSPFKGQSLPCFLFPIKNFRVSTIFVL